MRGEPTRQTSQACTESLFLFFSFFFSLPLAGYGDDTNIHDLLLSLFVCPAPLDGEPQSSPQRLSFFLSLEALKKINISCSLLRAFVRPRFEEAQEVKKMISIHFPSFFLSFSLKSSVSSTSSSLITSGAVSSIFLRRAERDEENARGGRGG